MIKYLIKKNQSLTLYLLSNIVIILVPLILLFRNIYGQESYRCYTELGSFRMHACSLSEYLYDHILWLVVAIIYAQIVLVPAAVITHLLMTFVQTKYKNVRKKNVWVKYLLALPIYIISTGIIIIILWSYGYP